MKYLDFLNEMKPYLKYDTWEIQLNIEINFMSSEDNDEEFVIHSKSDNIEIMINDKAAEIIEELFQ